MIIGAAANAKNRQVSLSMGGKREREREEVEKVYVNGQGLRFEPTKQVVVRSRIHYVLYV